jgi:hypothetical protein
MIREFLDQVLIIIAAAAAGVLVVVLPVVPHKAVAEVSKIGNL